MKDWEWLFCAFSTVLPEQAKSTGDSRNGVWQVVDYQTDDFSGTLILAQPTSNAPDVTVKNGLFAGFLLPFRAQKLINTIMDYQCKRDNYGKN
ncbi:MAG TPA: hypothetical protein PK165_01335 [bacterium]|nr:hypothetical protein [bacterium]HOL49671.1 hypothetical protein [bacterium]HPO51456.1 hypothetical protein [bacterium]HXK44710.1 hypothetical protein [bacterium]